MQNELERLALVLETCLPGCKARLDAPANPEGLWFLDAQSEGHGVSLEWRPGKGFGLTANADAGYGEGPEEVYTDFPAAFRRILQLLMFREQTVPPPAVRLGELR